VAAYCSNRKYVCVCVLLSSAHVLKPHFRKTQGRHTHMHSHTYTHTHTHMHPHAHTHAHTYTQTCVHTHRHTPHTNTHTHTCFNCARTGPDLSASLGEAILSQCFVWCDCVYAERSTSKDLFFTLVILCVLSQCFG
jgi:hypothetical protein